MSEDLEEQARREAEAHFRWAREARLRREAQEREGQDREAHERGDAPGAAPPGQPPAGEPTVEPVGESPVGSSRHEEPRPEPATAEAPTAEAAPAVEPPVVAAFRASAGDAVQPASEPQWREIELGRRELLGEWARLSKARERIETAYERLDDLRQQLDSERRQLERQRERLWMERFHLVSETQRPEPRPVAADRPWRDAASHLVEAAVVVRAAVAQRAPQLLARLRGRATGGRSPGSGRRELPPGP